MDEMTELAHLKNDLIGKVRETTDKAVTYTQNFVEYRHLWTDDRKVRNRFTFRPSSINYINFYAFVFRKKLNVQFILILSFC